MQIHFPLFVRAKDCGEIKKINSVYDLQREVEQIDVENGEYEAWDTEGLPVQMALQEPVWINVALSGDKPDTHRLRQALAEYAKSVGLTVRGEIPLSSFGTLLEQIIDEHEKKKLERSAIRRFFKKLG